MSDDTVKFFRLGKDKSFRVQAITRNHRGIYFTGNMLKKIPRRFRRLTYLKDSNRKNKSSNLALNPLKSNTS